MTQEEKSLLLQDLCARLPYGVICHYEHKFVNTEVGDGKIRAIYLNDCLETDFAGIVINSTETGLGYIKPYLLPMSSMTEEEAKEYNDLCFCNTPYPGIAEDAVAKFMDWLNEHHFDYRGLIPMDLAFEAPDGIYNIKEK